MRNNARSFHLPDKHKLYKLASLIGIIAGSVFVWANIPPLPPESRIASIIFWVILLGLTIYFIWVRKSTGGESGTARPNAPFIYGVSCIAMVIGFFLASLALRSIDAMEAMPAAAAAIVGLHFFPVGHAFQTPFFFKLAAIMSIIGACGIILALNLGAPFGSGAAVTVGLAMLALQAWDAVAGVRKLPQ